MSSYEKSGSSYNPQSNALKNILKNPKEEKRTFGKEEFLARRRYFLEKLENEGGVPKPKPFISNSTKKKISNDKIKTSFNKTVNTSDGTKSTTTIKNKITKTNDIKNTSSNNEIKSTSSNNEIKSTSSNNEIKSTSSNNENVNLHKNEWTLANAKSESLKKILTLAEKKDTNTVGKNVFNARQKFFADSQLSSVEQLMPRPSTPPGYCYFERCPSPSYEPVRRNSYGLYSSTSPALSSSAISSSSPVLSSALPSGSPSLSSSSTYSLPWEHGNNKKKDIIQPKPQKSTNIIESLENTPLISKEIIKLPDPIIFKKETLSIDNPMSIKIEKIKALDPMIPKILESLPEPIHFTTQSLPTDEPITVKTINIERIEPQLPKHIIIKEKLPDPVMFKKELLPSDEPIEIINETVKMPEMNIPKIMVFLPKPITFKKELLPQDDLLDIKIETIKASEKQLPKFITFLPEPIKATKELLPQDKPLEIKKELVNSEDKKFLKIIKEVIEETYDKRKDLETDFNKTVDISSLTLESNIEEKKENKKTDESQPLIEVDNEITETEIESSNEKQPLLDFNNETTDISNENKPLLNDDPLIDFDTENFNGSITENTLNIDEKDESNKKNSIGSISDLLNNNGTLSLDEPLPRKSIPTYENDENVVDDLIVLSESEMSDKVKNWYNVVETAISEEEELEEKI